MFVLLSEFGHVAIIPETFSIVKDYMNICSIVENLNKMARAKLFVK
jgi:hypothetical protein